MCVKIRCVLVLFQIIEPLVWQTLTHLVSQKTYTSLKISLKFKILINFDEATMGEVQLTEFRRPLIEFLPPFRQQFLLLQNKTNFIVHLVSSRKYNMLLYKILQIFSRTINKFRMISFRYRNNTL